MNTPAGQPATQVLRKWSWACCVPRPEIVLLVVACGCTLAAKFMATRGYGLSSPIGAWATVVLCDGAFFAAVLGLLAGGYVFRPGRAVARVALVLAVLVCGWSGLNAAWLGVTGVQLQRGVLAVVLRNPAEFWPVVEPQLRLHPVLTACAALVGGVAIVWTVWNLVSPRPIVGQQRAWAWRAGIAVGFVVLFTASSLGLRSRVGSSPMGQVLGYSSHWWVVQSLFVDDAAETARSGERRLVWSGERLIGVPPTEEQKRPHVVLVLLESVSYRVDVPGTPEHKAMPTLARLRSEGVALTEARALVPQTGKAFWATLTGTTPDLGPDFVESVLMDEPVEGLPTVLRRVGYRSAFFQMAKGAFECAPGTFANFGFDWAWFRENLEDPSADVGYLGGDDFRLLDPALAWLTRDAEPALLMMITSVAHDPFETPAWFAAPAESQYERYLQTLRYTDAFVTALCERLEACGLAEQTLLCVLGDHGAGLRAEASRLRWVPYEEALRVPWILHWPGHLPAGEQVTWPCSQLDVPVTLLALLGFDVSAAGFEGRDALVPGDAARRLYFSAWFQGSPLGYVEGPRKRMWWPGSGEVLEFDLQADPDERQPIMLEAAQRDAVIADLTMWLSEAHVEVPAKRFRQRFVFDHWWAFSSGRYARAYYVP